METIDQLERHLTLEKRPKRIISLVPSISEFLIDIGLEKELIGITKFCYRPEEVMRNKIKVGGTKNLNIEKIAELEPDFIIANKEENRKEDVDYLIEKYPVWISDINNMDDMFSFFESMGKIFGKEFLIQNILDKIKFKPIEQKIRAIYLIWQEPYFAVGNETFIHDMMERAGFENCIQVKRYPEITIKEIENLNPHVVLLSTEPFPFNNKHVQQLQIQLKNSKVVLVDGEMFSWYGTRILHALPYIEKFIQELKNGG